MQQRFGQMLAFASAACITLGSSIALAGLPLEPGQSVTTFRSGFNGVNQQPFVVGVVDVRDPVCEAPGTNQNWFADIYSNDDAVSPTGLASDEWSAANLGQVFGVALDDAANPNIYVTSTSSYGNGGSSGRVFRLDGTDGSVSVLADLPNAGRPGLGNIAYDRNHQQLFVTNFEDGKIYRLALDGTILQTFDPFGADDGVAGFAPLSERIWGIQAFDCHLYFGTWSEDRDRQGTRNTVWSLEIAADGSLVGPEQLQLTQPVNGSGFTMPISDIAFSRDGLMMVAERGMRNDLGQAPHQARILEYAGGHGAWTSSGQTFSVGSIGGGTNSSGGVDYDCVDADNCNSGGGVLATGDALRCCSAPNNWYGLQVLPDTGGTVSNSYIIDLDNETTYQDKTAIGDVDSVRTCAPVSAACDQGPTGCTLTQGYWKTHNVDAKQPHKQTPWPIAETTMLCGMSWLDILETPPMGDAWYILAHQWIAASLNVASGASTTPDVDQALADGAALLATCSVDAGDQATATAVSSVLDDYNNGLIGPGHCDDEDQALVETRDRGIAESNETAFSCSVDERGGFGGLMALGLGLLGLGRRRRARRS